MSARLAQRNGKVTDSAEAKPSRVMAGRVEKNKAPGKTDVVKAASRIGTSRASKKKDPIQSKAVVPRKKGSAAAPKTVDSEKDSAALSKAFNDAEQLAKPVASDSKKAKDGGEVRLRKYAFTFHLAARLTLHDQVPRTCAARLRASS
jgi:hypothetical protein